MTRRGRAVAGVGVAVLAIAALALWLGRGKREAQEGAAPAGAPSVAGGRGPTGGAGGAGAKGQPLRFASGRPLIDAKWGSAAGQLGRRRGSEEAPEGPMSFAVGPGGEVLVLDQVNARVQRFGADGKPGAAINVATDTFQDLAVDREGRVYALDRLADQEVAIFGPDGQPLAQVGVVGGPITEGGSVTGLSVGADGVWVEREHVESVHIAGPGGQPDPDRTTRPGRPLRDGSGFIGAALQDPAAGRAVVKVWDREGRPRWERPVTFPRPILQLLLLDSDLRGHVFVGAEVGVEDPQPPHDFTDLADVVIRLSQEGGAEAGMLVLPASEIPEEVLRRLVITDDGDVLQMLLSDDGAAIVRYAF